jgi:hypothetical protein
MKDKLMKFETASLVNSRRRERKRVSDDDQKRERELNTGEKEKNAETMKKSLKERNP